MKKVQKTRTQKAAVVVEVLMNVAIPLMTALGSGLAVYAAFFMGR